ncbi:MAG: flagellum-specific ATP synthase FliI, partial [Bdellovibrionaceae bacterium]|nr:flagellum-specific ATP synthase FliI [Pseudobdellovibrionaceae bacterium]
MHQLGAIDLSKYMDLVSSLHLSRESGKVIEVNGMLIRGYLPGAAIGSICQVYPAGHDRGFLAEVVAFKEKTVLMMPLEEMRGIGLGAKILLSRQIASVKVSDELLGRVVDGLGRPIDGLGPVENTRDVPLYAEPRNPLHREPIREALDLGIRSINGVLTVGRGQRVSIIAGSGVGKSVLLGMMARYTDADVNVIALIGERGREVREFIENDLGPEGMAKSVV